MKYLWLAPIAFFSTVPVAAADCRADIQALLQAGETWQNYRIETATLIEGVPVQHTGQWFRDYSHFYQIVEETGVHWLVLGSEEYTSSDGETWQRSQMRSENWLEETLAQNARLRESIRDTECGTETIDGKAFAHFAYIQETTSPVASRSRVSVWLDPETLRPAVRRMIVTTPAQAVDFGETRAEIAGSEVEMTTQYYWDEKIVLPSP
ncbi:hypothetical protein [Pelagibacterium xiamenense]|uniref:hypothetical protein n=1 Tax=Pelagibacterium xiamenense TaxID=2901140 RepID=UPI001E3D0815|nr:hypothetical protein [Pelagibacterium xiamenense]MCD7058635.1 hypothetical protein [Pelagibacterium xiamenense]